MDQKWESNPSPPPASLPSVPNTPTWHGPTARQRDSNIMQERTLGSLVHGPDRTLGQLTMPRCSHAALQ